VKFPYQQTFNAIGDAVTVVGGALHISVASFEKSFNQSIDASTTALRQAATMSAGFAVKRVEGHGWIIDPPSGSRWVAYEGTPVGELLQALTAASTPATTAGAMDSGEPDAAQKAEHLESYYGSVVNGRRRDRSI
jgi:hypothetical protein